MTANSNRWDEIRERTSGADYDARFAALAARGVEVHGEARMCASLVPAESRVLDAGCGTGRVAIQLASWGYHCVGVDSDPSMLAQARRSSSQVEWVLADLASLHTETAATLERFDLIVAAGNVIPLLADGTEHAVLANLTSLLQPTGRLVTGFGLAPETLPLAQAPFDLETYDAWCSDVGLHILQRFATWEGSAYTRGNYAVTVHAARSDAIA